MQQKYYAEYNIYINGKLFILDLVTICGSLIYLEERFWLVNFH